MPQICSAKPFEPRSSAEQPGALSDNILHYFGPWHGPVAQKLVPHRCIGEWGWACGESWMTGPGPAQCAFMWCTVINYKAPSRISRNLLEVEVPMPNGPGTNFVCGAPRLGRASWHLPCALGAAKRRL